MFRPARIQRCTTAFLVVVALLFSQLALANYVCPAMAGMGAPCEGMDDAQPVLCHQYAADAAHSVELVKLPSPSVPALIQLVVLPVAAALDEPRPAATGSPDLRPPPDPLFLSTLRLRV
jgi:hypothetical protein